MIGTIVNGVAIVICALVGKFVIGRFFAKGLPVRFEEIIKKAIGLSVMYIGISGALEKPEGDASHFQYGGWKHYRRVDQYRQRYECDRSLG